MKLINWFTKNAFMPQMKTIESHVFRNGRVTEVTAGADVYTDENSREECLDGPRVIPRD